MLPPICSPWLHATRASRIVAWRGAMGGGAVCASVCSLGVVCLRFGMLAGHKRLHRE